MALMSETYWMPAAESESAVWSASAVSTRTETSRSALKISRRVFASTVHVVSCWSLSVRTGMGAPVSSEAADTKAGNRIGIRSKGIGIW
jgi:hypothetical protein